MLALLNLLAAIALLVWGTHIVRTGMLRVFGENLRRILAASFANRFRAVIAGLGVTSIVQSSTATCLIVALVRRQEPGDDERRARRHARRRRRHQPDGGRVLVRPVVALAAADLRRRRHLHLAPEQRRRRDRPRPHRPRPDHAGAAADRRRDPAADRIAGGARAPRRACRTTSCSTSLVGAVLTVLSYSSLAIVLLIATLAASGDDPARRSRSAWCSAPTSAAACSRCWPPRTRRRRCAALPLGNLIFKSLGALLVHRRSCRRSHVLLQQLVPDVHQQVVAFHLAFNVALAIALHRLHRPGRPHRRPLAARALGRRRHDCSPRHLDPLALTMPSLAISLRGARGAAPGRRRRDDAARHRPGDPQQRPARCRRS